MRILHFVLACILFVTLSLAAPAEPMLSSNNGLHVRSVPDHSTCEENATKCKTACNSPLLNAEASATCKAGCEQSHAGCVRGAAAANTLNKASEAIHKLKHARKMRDAAKSP